MNIIFGTVFYERAYDFLPDFVSSVDNQTSKTFKVLIINDGIEHSKLEELLKGVSFKYEIIQYVEKYNPSELRVKLLIEARNRNADLLIMGDADDMFSSDRVECIIETLVLNENYVFFYNNIKTMSGDDIFPELPTEIKEIGDICDYNFLGLSNTAIRINSIDMETIESFFEGRQEIFDWYLFSRILLDGKIGKYVNNAVTYYRYHDNNLVGNQDKTDDIIKREVSVKKNHYKSLKNRSLLMKKKYSDYMRGNYLRVETSGHHYWWGFTKGGK